MVSFLEEKLHCETRPEVLAGLLGALYELEQYERVQSLLSLLGDENYMVRCQVLDALQESRDEDRVTIVTALKSLLQHEEHAAVKADAGEILNHLTKDVVTDA